jgi:hypothetical protein
MLSEAKHLGQGAIRLSVPIGCQAPLNSTNRLRNVVVPTFFTA